MPAGCAMRRFVWEEALSIFPGWGVVGDTTRNACHGGYGVLRCRYEEIRVWLVTKAWTEEFALSFDGEPLSSYAQSRRSPTTFLVLSTRSKWPFATSQTMITLIRFSGSATACTRPSFYGFGSQRSVIRCPWAYMNFRASVAPNV